MSLIEIYKASLTGKVKVNVQYKASKIWYTIILFILLSQLSTIISHS